MRLSTVEDADEELALETIAAAAAEGVIVFDTARAYGNNEELVARALRRCGAGGRARIVTKGGMTRPGGGWVPDGRAKAIRADCEASLAALDGFPIDLYLLHASDPRTPWRTSVRALARLVDEGVVRRIGLSNVNRKKLDESLELAPQSAVQVLRRVRRRRPRSLRRARRRRDRALAAGGPRRIRRLARAGVGTRRREAWCDSRGDRARLGARPSPLVVGSPVRDD
jgi:aryl-alcohol dehydrogenase-like predicted oxidoreductase